jgi:hypothetical protein
MLNRGHLKAMFGLTLQLLKLKYFLFLYLFFETHYFDFVNRYSQIIEP